MSIKISRGDPRHPDATDLLKRSHALMERLFPPEDNFYLDIDALCGRDIRFFVAKEHGRILGVGALALRDGYGEVKAMFTRESARSLFRASRVDGFSFDLEILWLAQRWGLGIEEIPVQWIEAPGSTVKPGRESLRFLRDVAALRYRDLRGHYSPSMPAAVAA